MSRNSKIEGYLTAIRLITFTLLFSIGISHGQVIAFECDPNYKVNTKNWADPQVTAIYDSLNKVNYAEVYFELRIWQYSYGQMGLVQDVLILSYGKDSTWQGFHYSAFKDGKHHKNIAEFFSDNQLLGDSINLEVVWDSLVNLNILQIQPPGREELYKKYGFYVQISHDTHYTIELLKENCKRRYAFSYGMASVGNFEHIPEFKDLRKIVALRAKLLHEAGKYGK